MYMLHGQGAAPQGRPFVCADRRHRTLGFHPRAAFHHAVKPASRVKRPARDGYHQAISAMRQGAAPQGRPFVCAHTSTDPNIRLGGPENGP